MESSEEIKTSEIADEDISDIEIYFEQNKRRNAPTII